MAEFKEIQIGADGQVYEVKDETARQNAGSGGEGTVTGVKMNNGLPIEPDGNGVVDLGTVITQHQDISGKVDKDPNKELIPSTDLAKLQNLPTATELTTQLGQKANDNAVVKSVSVNGQTPAATPDQNGNVNIQAVKSVTINGTTTPVDNSGNVNLGDVDGEDGVGFDSVSSAQDGTVVITLTNGDTITIDLNHNHPDYLKYVLCEDMADYISMTKDSSTLYLIPVE